MENLKENKMGTMPIGRLIITMSLPMIVSMLVQAMYNVVDSIFVARVSQDALSAVSMVFPIQNLMIAMGVGMGVGMNALLSRSLGSGDRKKVNAAATQAIYIYAVLYFIFLIVGLFFSNIFMKSQTDIPSIVTDGADYMWIVCVASVGLFGQLYIEKLLQSTGKTVLSMVIQGLGAIINIILDPILIFGKISLPFVGTVVEFEAMGVRGAAWATVIGQIIAALLGVFINAKYNREVKITPAKPDFSTIKTILAVGIPSGVMGSIGSVMTYGMNRILISFSSACVSVFGAYFKLQSFVFMPVFGMNNGMVPIVAYNYGARRPDRMKRTIFLSVIYAVVIMLAGLLVFQLFPAQLLALFDADEEMLSVGIRALRTISLAYVFAGFCVVITSVFQALGHGLMSVSVSLVRQIFVLLPVAFLFSLSGNVGLVWLSFPIAEIVSMAMCVIFYVKIHRRYISGGASRAALEEKE